MTLERLAGLDAIFTAAETPANHMHMMAIMVLDPSSVPGGYSFEKLKDFIASRLAQIPPLRRRLVEVPFGLARPYWIDDSELDLDLHIRRAAVPKPGGARELAEMAGVINGRQLDRSRPLWEMVVVEDLQDGSIALLAKVHHALMDGMAGMQFLATFVSDRPDLTELPPAESKSPVRTPSALGLLASAVPDWAAKPVHIARAAGNALQLALRGALESADAQPADSPVVHRTIFNQPATPERSAAYLSLPLGDIKRVGKAFSATVNEVVLAVVAGALRQYLEELGESLDAPLVAGVPASTHAAGGDDIANSYGVLFTSLATHIADPLERLQQIRDSSREEKKRESAFWGDALAEISEIPSPLLIHFVTRAVLATGLAQRVAPFCNLVVSNVPGPPVTLYFGGTRIRHVYPLGPIFEGVSLNITLISVSGSLDVGLSSCRSALRDLWGLAEGLSFALQELIELVEAEAKAAQHVAEAPLES